MGTEPEPRRQPGRRRPAPLHAAWGANPGANAFSHCLHAQFAGRAPRTCFSLACAQSRAACGGFCGPAAFLARCAPCPLLICRPARPAEAGPRGAARGGAARQRLHYAQAGSHTLPRSGRAAGRRPAPAGGGAALGGRRGRRCGAAAGHAPPPAAATAGSSPVCPWLGHREAQALSQRSSYRCRRRCRHACGCRYTPHTQQAWPSFRAAPVS